MAECVAKERKILVGVDEGEESMYALSWCLNNILVSQNSKDTLILLYAKAPRPVYTGIDGTVYMFSPDIMATMDRYTNELAESVMEKAKRLCKEVHHLDTISGYNSDLDRPGQVLTQFGLGLDNPSEPARVALLLCKEVYHLDVKVETRVVYGDPRDVICQAAENLGVDMVVLGSHGYGLIKRAFLGSVSNHCAQKAKCPVLIVKRPKSIARDE